MSKFAFSAVAAGLIGGAMMLTGATPASAATLPSPAVVAPGDTAMVEEVRRHGADRPRRWDRRAHRWDRRAHGPRFRHARPGFRHHYGGYYYSSPWWTGPAIGFGLTLPGVTFGLTAPHGHAGLPAAHVQWCMNRYRTYDPATDTYFPRIGVRARCSSPYVTW